MRSSVLRGVAAAMVCGGMGIPATASAAQLTVDDDRVQCPSADYTSIAAAVGAAMPGDVVSICDGVYREGTGGPGSNAITIYKAVTLRGAGAGRVFVIPNGGPGKTLVPAGPSDFRDTRGDIISVVDTRADISGITVFGDGVAVDAGIGFHSSMGSVTSSEIVDLTPPGGLGATDGGIGIVVHHGPEVPDPLPIPHPTGLLKSVTIRDNIVEGYNKAGIVVDSQRADGSAHNGASLPLRGAFAAVVDNHVKGAGSQAAIAQDGIRFGAGATGVIVENGVTGNHYTPDRTLSAGVRFDRSSSTTQTRVNLNGLQSNGMALVNAPQTGTYRIDAVRNWWGSPLGPSASDAPDRGDPISGALSGGGGVANRSTSVDFQEFLTAPAPLDAPLSEWQDKQPSVTLAIGAGGLTAEASDDIGIRSVTFMSDDKVIAVDRVAPYAAPWTPGTGTETLLAVAHDSRGQTATAAKAYAPAPAATPVPTVTPEATATPVPLASVDDRAPTVTLDAPTGARDAFTATATAADDRGVARVVFLLGTREVCRVTAAPFTCTVSARADEVGRQTLTAIVTDSTGQTATSMRSVTVEKFSARSVTHKSTGTRGRVTTTGKLSLPTGLSAREVCSGEVAITYKRGSKTVRSKRVKLSSSCGFSTREALARGSYTVSVEFRGNDALASTKAANRKATVR